MASHGRAKGGCITKFQATLFALSLPIRFTITSGHWRNCSQARSLLDGLSGVEQVIWDAGHYAEHCAASSWKIWVRCKKSRRTLRDMGKRHAIERFIRNADFSSLFIKFRWLRGMDPGCEKTLS